MNNGVTEPRNQRASFAPQPETVAAVRRFLRAALPDVEPDLVDNATLLASEVAANVVEHARTDYEVRIGLSEHKLRIAVADGSSVIPAVQELAADADRGRGLRMLSAVADAWGVGETPTGKEVWFELALEPRPENSG
jgi:anti-sigma regulatory factor (Ser/Thr protein kinase)